MRFVARVLLIHWNAQEAATLLETLRRAGHVIDYDEKADYGLLRRLRLSPAEAVVIDLARLPSHGREVATAIRGSKATRHIPIVFLNGAAEKVEAIRRQLPDAVYTSTADLESALREAIDKPPQSPVVPTQMMSRYAGRTAAEKLGIKGGCTVALVDPPREYRRVLGEVPADVRFQEQDGDGCAVTLWFVREPDSYRRALPRMRDAAGCTKLWAVWPKQKALTQTMIREGAVAIGLVDYKICSIDEAWSAMALARPRSRKGADD
jgi:CheY-like chemotaxis protein